jgi:hypothetical protein
LGWGADLSTSVCVPKISFEVPNVQLPFGIEFQAVADFSKGPPSQCAMLSSLLVQIMPAMAAMSPLIKILNVFAALKDFLPANVLKLPALLDALAEVIAMLDPLPFVAAVKSILLLVIAYLQCFIQTMEGLLEFQASIDLSLAAGNPDLQASLQCASNNASVSIQQLMQSLGPIGPIMQLVQPFISIAGVPISLPSISDLQGEKDIEQALQSLSTMLTDLQQVLEAIPA